MSTTATKLRERHPGMVSDVALALTELSYDPAKANWPSIPNLIIRDNQPVGG